MSRFTDLFQEPVSAPEPVSVSAPEPVSVSAPQEKKSIKASTPQKIKTTEVPRSGT